MDLLELLCHEERESTTKQPKKNILNKHYLTYLVPTEHLEKMVSSFFILYSTLNGKWSLNHKLVDDLNLNSIAKIIIQHKSQAIV